MGYEGDLLRPWFATGPVDRALHRMAVLAGGRARERVAENTPIDTGRLRKSWRVKPPREVRTPRGERAIETGVETSVSYALDVEYPTGLYGPKHAKYEIKPRRPGGMLRFRLPDGRVVFARRVMHPGSPGAHMLFYGMAKAEDEFPEAVKPALILWAREQERRQT